MRRVHTDIAGMYIHNMLFGQEISSLNVWSRNFSVRLLDVGANLKLMFSLNKS